MRYEEIQENFPLEFALRDQDKYRYRYPKGEVRGRVCCYYLFDEVLSDSVFFFLFVFYLQTFYVLKTNKAIHCLHSSTLIFEGFLNKSESPVPAFSNEFKYLKKVILCKFRVLLLTCKMISAHFLCLLWVSAPLIGAKVWNICGSTFLWVVRRL